jgi:hypothetical protein
MHADRPPAGPEVAPGPPKEVRVVYLKYRDPSPLEFPDRPERLPGPVFHAAGVLLREDDEFLALGELAFADENGPLAQRYGHDLFPAYRNVLSVPKSSVIERRDMVVTRASDPGSAAADAEDSH